MSGADAAGGAGPVRRTGGLLLVHAHPDDESIGTGATMAHYAAAGAPVTLITCTRGEQGEIIPPELSHLAADREDRLGEHRVGELAAAMAELGVTDHRLLDEIAAGLPPVRYRDSGMAYAPDGSVIPAPDPRPEAFAPAELDPAAQRAAAVIREVRPRAVITYDPGGGYGHPDHVQAHRVAMRAVELAASPGPGPRATAPGGSAPGESGAGESGAGDGQLPGWDVPKVYWIGIPESLMRRLLRDLNEQGENPFEGWSADGPLPSMVMPDELITARIDGTAVVEAKLAALRAHASQISVEGGFFALSNGIGNAVAGIEFFRQVRGTPAGPRDEDGWETDLLAVAE